MNITPIENPVERAADIIGRHKQLINYTPFEYPDMEDIASLLCDIRLYCDHAEIDFYEAIKYSYDMYLQEKFRRFKNENQQLHP
jgi:hypothetical protein